MKKTVIATGFAIAAFGGSPAANAATGVPLNTQGIYFEIGGGDVLRDTLNASPILNAGLSAELNLAMSCDLWDGIHIGLDAYAEMVADHLEAELTALPQQIVTQLMNGVQGYLTAALQRAMPGMYDWAMNIDAQLQGDIEVARMSCEAALEDVNAGNNPFKGWVEESEAFSWMAAIDQGQTDFDDGTEVFEDGTPNILYAKEAVATNKGEADVPWLTGPAGGASGEPINLVKDTVIAGYAIQAGDADLANEAATAVQEVAYNNIAGEPQERVQRLGELWATAGDAAAWANEVLGEQTISYCDECEGSTTAGKGLGYAAHLEKNTVLDAWSALLEEGDLMRRTVAELRTVSSTKVQITQDVMESLSSMAVQDRNLFITRLASDVGTYRAVEKALSMRRLLQSALTTPDVQAHPPAVEDVEKLIAELRREVEDFMFEIETSKRLVSDVPAALIAYRDATKARSVQTLYGAPGAANSATLRGTVIE